MRSHLAIVASVGDDGEASRWLITVDSEFESRTANVVVERADDDSRADIPVEYKSELRSVFETAQLGIRVSVDVHEDTAKWVCHAPRLSLAVKRVLTTIYGAYMGQVFLNISIRPGLAGSHVLVFDTVMALDFSEPLTFGTGFTFRSVDMAAAVVDVDDVKVTPELGSDPGTPELPAFSERVESIGDVRSSGLGPLVDWSNLTPLEAPDLSHSSPENDAHLYASTSPSEKYSALADVIDVDAPGDVLVIGDHPGLLSRAIACNGTDVVGIDPLNRDFTETGQGGVGDRVCKKAEFVLADPAVPPDKDWDFAIADTGTDGETADVATARNVAIARYFAGKGIPCIAQTRSLPMHDGNYAVFLLPGTSRVGCEAYVLLSDPACAKPRCWKVAWFFLRVEAGSATIKLNRYKDCAVVTKYFKRSSDGRFEVDEDSWYAFLASRHFIEAAYAKTNDLFDQAVYKAENPVDLLSRIAPLAPDLGDGRNLKNLFERSRVTEVPGLSPGAFRRSRSLPLVMEARYKELLKDCAASSARAGGGVSAIMTDVRAGILLRDLSQVRAALGEDIALATSARVLPIQHMGVLASRMFYRFIRLYVFGVASLIGRPMHPWELQYLLWSLSHFGTRSDKLRYLTLKLRECVYYSGGGRRVDAVSDHSFYLKAFLSKLDDLGVRRSYVDADPVFGRAVAASPLLGGARRAQQQYYDVRPVKPPDDRRGVGTSASGSARGGRRDSNRFSVFTG